MLALAREKLILRKEKEGRGKRRKRRRRKETDGAKSGGAVELSVFFSRTVSAKMIIFLSPICLSVRFSGGVHFHGPKPAEFFRA